jgi:hypothetical protein
MFIAIAGLFPRRRDGLGIGLLLASALLLALFASASGFELKRIAGVSYLPSAAIIVVAFAVSLLVVTLSNRSVALVVLTIAYPIFVWSEFAVDGTPSWSAYGRTCKLWEQEFETLVDLNMRAWKLQPAASKTWIWQGPKSSGTLAEGCDTPLVPFRYSLVFTGFTALGTASDRSAGDITDESVGSVVDGGLVQAIVADEKPLNELAKRFERNGKILEPVDRRAISIGTTPAVSALFRVKPANQSN